MGHMQPTQTLLKYSGTFWENVFSSVIGQKKYQAFLRYPQTPSVMNAGKVSNGFFRFL